jgi:hypothetical protein
MRENGAGTSKTNTLKPNDDRIRQRLTLRFLHVHQLSFIDSGVRKKRLAIKK